MAYLLKKQNSILLKVLRFKYLNINILNQFNNSTVFWSHFAESN